MVDEKPLTNPVASSQAIREVPEGAGGAVLSAKFILNKLGLTRAQLIRAGNASAIPIRAAISRMVRGEYRRSGLKKRTGNLLVQATTRFRVNVIVKSLTRMVVLVTWSPTIKYFFVHLFGTGPKGIVPKTEDFLHFKIGNKWIRTKGPIHIKARPFLKFTSTLRDQIEVILERQIRIAAEAKPSEVRKEAKRKRKVKPARRRVARRRPEIKRLDLRGPVAGRRARVRARADITAVAKATELVKAAKRRPTPFKLRKALRTGGLSPAEARRIVSQFTSVAGTGLLTQAAVSALGKRLTDPAAQAIIQSTIGFQLLLQGER